MGVYRRPDSPLWWYSFVHNGKRFQASTGATDKKVAHLVYLRERNDHVQGKATGRLAPLQLSDLITRYLDDYSAVNKISHASDGHRAGHLFEFMGDKVAGELGPHDFERYKAHRRKMLRGGTPDADGKAHSTAKPISPATVNRELAFAKAVYNKGIEWGLVSSNPVERVHFFSERERVRTRYLSQEEKARLLAVCSPELRQVVIFALKTGCRISEILGMRWIDLDLKANTITLRKTKAKSLRHVPLHPDALEILKALPRRGESIFADKDGNRYNRSAWVRSQFENAVEAAGIRGFTFHDLCHTFASELVMKGADLKTVSELLGHSTTRMAERYSHLSPSHKSLAVNLLGSELKAKRNGSRVRQAVA